MGSKSENRPLSVGCVSFLNARPLIAGLEDRDDLRIRYDVPSALLEELVAGEVDMALCPVIDFQTAGVPLEIVPVGGIGCDGETHTVRLFSRVPIEQIREVGVDTDSHTSVVLLRVVLDEMANVRPELIELPSSRQELRRGAHRPQAVLLIGDKVVLDCPTLDDYPHRLDLGVAWKQLTGLPFVFAVWMARRGAALGQVPALLERQRLLNGGRIETIVEDHALPLGWPAGLARRYLGELLQYQINGRELEAMQRFWGRAHELGVIERLRPLALHAGAASAAR